MRCNDKRIGNAMGLAVMMFGGIGGLTGCASPPAVSPLMRVVTQALQQEQAMLATDQQRTAAWMDQQRAMLKAAFDADMNEQQTLDKAWVNDHAAVYVAARETLLRHELELQRQNEQRRENMTDAMAAQQRAMQLIERQDALLAAVPDARRWLQQLQQQQEDGQ
ncbi:MAG: hypothetical protein WC058_03345 [Phycisphaeraceae bacterium]